MCAGYTGTHRIKLHCKNILKLALNKIHNVTERQEEICLVILLPWCLLLSKVMPGPFPWIKILLYVPVKTSNNFSNFLEILVTCLNHLLVKTNGVGVQNKPQCYTDYFELKATL